MQTTEYIDVKDTAKLVRKALRRVFPGTRFSVRSDRYAGGAAVRVHWTDGPAEPDVREVTAPYGGRGFDGSIDLAYDYAAWLEPDGTARIAETSGTTGSRGAVDSYLAAPPSADARLVRFGANYVTTSRRVTDEFAARALAVAERGTSGGLVCFSCHGGIPQDDPIILANDRAYHDRLECSQHAVTYSLSADTLAELEQWRDVAETLGVGAPTVADLEPRPCLAVRERGA